MKRRTLLLLMILVLLLLLLSWSVHVAIYAQHNGSAVPQLATQGNWQDHQYDLVYTIAFSRLQQPNGPLVVYRASGVDIQMNVPVIALQHEPLTVTPLFFPSPDGRYIALSLPHTEISVYLCARS